MFGTSFLLHPSRSGHRISRPALLVDDRTVTRMGFHLGSARATTIRTRGCSYGPYRGAGSPSDARGPCQRDLTRKRSRKHLLASMRELQIAMLHNVHVRGKPGTASKKPLLFGSDLFRKNWSRRCYMRVALRSRAGVMSAEF